MEGVDEEKICEKCILVFVLCVFRCSVRLFPPTTQREISGGWRARFPGTEML